MTESGISKNHLKLMIKKLLCIVRGVGASGENVYVSPAAELVSPQKIFLGDDVVLERRSRLWANGKGAKIRIGSNTTVYPYVLLKSNGGVIAIGNNCSINDYTILNGMGGITIGNNVRIAAHTIIVASEHDYRLLDRKNFSVDMQGAGISIGDNVWIGANVVILDGVKIGEGSVIGAGAVVSRDIPPDSIAVGVPARVIKKRI